MTTYDLVLPVDTIFGPVFVNANAMYPLRAARSVNAAIAPGCVEFCTARWHRDDTQHVTER
jgi:hypothetical protein